MSAKALLVKAPGYWRKIKFYGADVILTVFDKLLLAVGIKDHSLYISDKSRKTIVVSGKELNFRVLKYVKWLNTTGKYNFLLAMHQASSISDKDASQFARIVKYRNATHIRRMVANCNADAGIAFTSTPSFTLPLIEYANFPVVFDPYDCLIVYYGTDPHLSWMKKEVPSEGECFKKTNYVLARNLECRQSMIMHDSGRKPSILFSDYCDNENITARQPIQITAGSPISLVYSGGLFGKSARKSSHGIENFDDLVDCLEPNKIDLHLYPNPAAPLVYYYDYIVQAEKLKYLHIYQSVPQHVLAQKLSSYHFGILPHFKDPDSRILDYKLIYGTSNKFFNFLEAGLPIIVSDEMTYMAWMVKRYGIGIVISRIDLADLRAIIERSDYAQMQQNVLLVREKLSMKANLGRLVRFIDSVR